jgi:hypothetical protein
MGETGTPQAIVAFMLEQHGMTRADLTSILGGRSRVSEFFSGKRRLSVPQILKLREVLRVPAGGQLGQQAFRAIPAGELAGSRWNIGLPIAQELSSSDGSFLLNASYHWVTSSMCRCPCCAGTGEHASRARVTST